MYQTEHSMRAILPVYDYVSQEAANHDRQLLRQRSWQLIGTQSMVKNPGDFVATERFGIPVMLRNHDGELTALRNVCAHRNCQIAEQGCGHAAELKCPYHGWRYGADGRTRKIPAAKNFPHFDREAYRLDRFPIKNIGPLQFVYLGDVGEKNAEIALECFDDWQNLLSDRTDPKHWQFLFHDRLEYPCDWKVVIEGSLESYHLAEVHPESFGSDPGEENSDHLLKPSGSSFQTRARESSFLSRLEERLIRYLSGSFDPLYQHIHIYPGIMASMTDTITIVYQIFPHGRGKSAMDVFAYSRTSESPGLLKRAVANLIGRGAKKIARQVLAEDASIFPQVQAGMEAASKRQVQRPRIFGRCEERLQSFGSYWKQVSEGLR
jgi:phenylpropionate dioxygenase-like ring-hydroxylating dioxygenase large terminal subunit